MLGPPKEVGGAEVTCQTFSGRKSGTLSPHHDYEDDGVEHPDGRVTSGGRYDPSGSGLPTHVTSWATAARRARRGDGAAGGSATGC